MNYYEINGIKYPRVTSILGILDKPALLYWAVNMATEYIDNQFFKVFGNNLNKFDEWNIKRRHMKDILEAAKKEWRNVAKEAQDIGSEVHSLISIYIKTGVDPTKKQDIQDAVVNAFLAFLEWEKENIKEWLVSEYIVHCPKHKYAGTLDVVAMLKDGKVYVIDFKSSKGFYPEMKYQIAAYRHAYEVGKREEINGMGVLRLDKETGVPHWKDYSDEYEQAFKAFTYLCKFWHLTKKIK